MCVVCVVFVLKVVILCYLSIFVNVIVCFCIEFVECGFRELEGEGIVRMGFCVLNIVVLYCCECIVNVLCVCWVIVCVVLKV